jgi:hypothetical protein
MPKQTTFPTISLHRIRHLVERAEQLDAEEAVALCLDCGHPANDHSIENETCWHMTNQNGRLTICKCSGWRQGALAAPVAD